MTDIITRAEAKAQGLKRYFTGKPCKHGHVKERLVSNGNCLTCGFLKTKDWRTANPETCEQHRLNWEAKDPQKALDVDRAAKKKWDQSNPVAVLVKAANYRAKKHATASLLTAEEKAQVAAIYKQCQQLNAEAGCIAFHVDHIHPVSKGGAHHPDNLQILTAEENRTKCAKVAA